MKPPWKAQDLQKEMRQFTADSWMSDLHYSKESTMNEPEKKNLSSRQREIALMSNSSLQHEIYATECQLEGIFRNLFQVTQQRQLSHTSYIHQHAYVMKTAQGLFDYLVELAQESVTRHQRILESNPKAN